MGSDEHGPAYPDGEFDHFCREHNMPEGVQWYHCPICNGDQTRYHTCEYPGCPDGRDRGHPHARRFDVHRPRMQYEHMRERNRVGVWALILLSVMAATILAGFVFCMLTPAHAMDHGFDPNNATVQWFEKLQRPDQPGSCCGKADAYPVGSYVENADGSVDATVSDGSAKAYPDGTYRPYFPTGEVVHVEKVLVNKHDDDIDNPTDTSWVFMTVNNGVTGHVYCLIRHPSGN